VANEPAFLSLFSGVGGFDLGLERAGWRCVGQCEIDPWRRGILARHWPDVPRWDDVRSVQLADGREGDARDGRQADGAPQRPDASRADLICGGFPCQDLSVAGKRAGLKGERSGLFFEAMRIVAAVQPRWVLLENVPGLLSSHGGRDFAVVLASLAELGYGVAWRVLDSRYFGVAQRRRRVFIVGHLGARSPAPFRAFLEGGEGNPAAGEPSGEEVAGSLGGGSGKRGWCNDLDRSGAFVTAPTLTAANDPSRSPQSSEVTQQIEAVIRARTAFALRRDPDGVGNVHNTNFVTHALTGEGHDASEDGTGRGTPLVAHALCAHQVKGGDPTTDNYVARSGVRRLTPVECCRLQGFPDDWLGTPNEPPDSPRYAALGDAVTVPVIEWIGRQLLIWRGR